MYLNFKYMLLKAAKMMIALLSQLLVYRTAVYKSCSSDNIAAATYHPVQAEPLAQLHTFLSILLHSASDTNALKPRSPKDCPELLLARSSAGSPAA
jgi:hypothetical protein